MEDNYMENLNTAEQLGNDATMGINLPVENEEATVSMDNKLDKNIHKYPFEKGYKYSFHQSYEDSGVKVWVNIKVFMHEKPMATVRVVTADGSIVQGLVNSPAAANDVAVYGKPYKNEGDKEYTYFKRFFNTTEELYSWLEEMHALNLRMYEDSFKDKNGKVVNWIQPLKVADTTPPPVGKEKEPAPAKTAASKELVVQPEPVVAEKVGKQRGGRSIYNTGNNVVINVGAGSRKLPKALEERYVNAITGLCILLEETKDATLAENLMARINFFEAKLNA